MPQDRAASAYRADFVRRVKIAREARDLTQPALAKLLGISQTTYSKYEGGRRTLLPHALVEKFCIACGVDMPWLFTGIGKGPPIPAPDPPRRPHKQAGTPRRPALEA